MPFPVKLTILAQLISQPCPLRRQQDFLKLIAISSQWSSRSHIVVDYANKAANIYIQLHVQNTIKTLKEKYMYMLWIYSRIIIIPVHCVRVPATLCCTLIRLRAKRQLGHEGQINIHQTAAQWSLAVAFIIMSSPKNPFIVYVKARTMDNANKFNDRAAHNHDDNFCICTEYCKKMCNIGWRRKTAHIRCDTIR